MQSTGHLESHPISRAYRPTILRIDRTAALATQRRRLAVLADFLEDAHRADLALAARNVADAMAALR